MKKKLFKKPNMLAFGIFRITVLCIAGVAALLRALSLLLFYDADIGYYENGSVLPIIFRILITVAVIGIFVMCVSVFRKNAPDIEKYTVSSRCSAVFAALAFAVATVAALLSPYSWADYYVVNTASVFFYLMTALYIAAPALACVYFVLYALGKCKASAAFGCGIFTILYFIITLAASYFNIYVQMNAPEKLAAHLCCICAMLLILGEMRVMCGAPKNAFYLFSVSTSAIALNACALPTVIASFAGVFTDGIIAPPDVSSYVFLALGIFAAVRIVMLDPEKDSDIEKLGKVFTAVGTVNTDEQI